MIPNAVMYGMKLAGIDNLQSVSGSDSMTIMDGTGKVTVRNDGRFWELLVEGSKRKFIDSFPIKAADCQEGTYLMGRIKRNLQRAS